MVMIRDGAPPMSYEQRKARNAAEAAELSAAIGDFRPRNSDFKITRIGSYNWGHSTIDESAPRGDSSASSPAESTG